MQHRQVKRFDQHSMQTRRAAAVSGKLLLFALVCGMAMPVAQAFNVASTEKVVGEWKIDEVLNLIGETNLTSIDESVLIEGCIASAHLQEHLRSQEKSDRVTLGNLFQRTRLDFMEEGPREALLDDCIRGMVDKVGDRAHYFSRSYFETSDAEDALGGIGLEFVSDPYGAEIIQVIPDAPAVKAGILVGEILTHIDQQSLAGKGLSEIQQRLRGKIDSTATITLLSRPSGETRTLQVTRQRVEVQAIVGQMLGEDIAYLNPRQLSHESFDQQVALLSKMARRVGRLKGIVLDLRNSLGGLLNACAATASLFLPNKKPLFSTQARCPGCSTNYTSGAETTWERPGSGVQVPWTLKDAPMVVLIDPTTAAGSEMIAAALQDNRRARLMGKRSMGAGTISSVFPIADGSALKIPTSSLVRPNKESIDQQGVEPDILFEAPNSTYSGPIESDRMVQRALELLRSPPTEEQQLSTKSQ